MFSTLFFAKCLCVGYDGPWASVSYCVTKTCLYNFDPLKPHFYIVKLGVYRCIHYFSYFCSKNIDCVYSLEPPHRRSSNEYPQSMFLSKNVKNIRVFYLKIFSFSEVKFSIYLNRGVFVMTHWFLLFLQFHSCSFPVPLFHCLYYLFYPFSPFSGRQYKMTHKG